MRGPAGYWRLVTSAAGALAVSAVLSACATASAQPARRAGARTARTLSPAARRPGRIRASRPAEAGPWLPAPAPLRPFTSRGPARQGRWHAAGRWVHGAPAVYETALVPPGGKKPAGIAWMDSRLLSARLYSGSVSPGGGPYRYTAPVKAAQARSMVAAFNGGFKMKDARGGYYTQHRMIDPLRSGAASLVIYADGSVGIGAWATDVAMTPQVVSVRQNLVPLVAAARPTAAASGNWHAWGSTCGARSCAQSVPGIDHQWRSGLGITADGALVYAAGPGLDPLQLASVLVRAGAVRAMQLDINPYWPVFVTYRPRSRRGLAAPSNGRKLLAGTTQGPATFFEPSWARDFLTMSARRGG
jgi:hypothetical protein